MLFYYRYKFIRCYKHFLIKNKISIFMISQRILNDFKNYDKNGVSYRVEIEDFKNGEVICNQESVILTVRQIYSSTSKQTERELTIYSDLIVNEDGDYIPVLNAYVSNEKVITNDEDETETSSSHYIEIVDTTLQQTISITFNRPYVVMPKITVNIDKQYESLYRNFSTKYIRAKGDPSKYTGVEITFNNLKSKQAYPEIGIVIIGDKKEGEYDENGNLITVNSGTLKISSAYIDEETEENIIVEGLKFYIDNGEQKDTFVTDNCGNANLTLNYGVYNITIDDEDDQGYSIEPIELDFNVNTSGVLFIPLIKNNGDLNDSG